MDLEPKLSDNGTGSGIPEKRKRFQRSLSVIIALIVLAALALWGVYMMSKPYDRTRTTYADFVVEEDADISAVAAALE